MTTSVHTPNLYSLIIAIHSTAPVTTSETYPLQADVIPGADWRLGEITVDWVDFTREKSLDRGQDEDEMSPHSSGESSCVGGGSSPRHPRKSTPGAGAGRTVPGSGSPVVKPTPTKKQTTSSCTSDPDSLSLQPLLAHFPGPNPLDSSYAQGLSELGRGVVHLFRHAPPPSLIAALDAHPVGEGSSSRYRPKTGGEWAGDKAEGEDGSLIAILAVPAWMRPADFLEFIGGWGTCLEGVRMIREATTPNRSIVLLKFRDPLQASDFLVIFTGRAFSTLDARETCHPIRIHHLVLHKVDSGPLPSSSTAVPAFPPSVYASRVRDLPSLLGGVSPASRYELPSCPVCLERLDSTVTGLVTLPCAHTFDCDCLRKWGDSRCPVCRLSHLLLSSSSHHPPGHSSAERDEITRLTKCSMCDSTENNWICVVCGVVGCGRYEPGKGHARRHWEESGHVLAMELETQRVWDYKGDNYVHRLIQTRNDGKLVELPSASSLVTPSVPGVLPLGSQPTPERNRNSDVHTKPPTHSSAPRPGTSNADAGPSSGDIDKISTIESITLEYSYLLSSQLESMRQHYEKEQLSLSARLSELEAASTSTRDRIRELEGAERAREKAEKKAEKAMELSRGLQNNLAAERAMTQGLSQRVKALEEQKVQVERGKKEKEEEVKMLEETVRDLMFTLEAGIKVQEAGGDGGEGGDLMVVPGQTQTNGKGKSKKGKK
ncbi:hypothetical protein IAR55_004181 [Kwoniella newhampshirensis]|uniref:BRCA1-associated protein n=1 Tax=Kwoniella newhampshirensis TaxID=1651941 RepID=A0AAW0YY67_9TREE